MPGTQPNPTDRAALDDSRQTLGARVKYLRETRGLTLQTLADRSGLAISTISKIERGLMAPTYDRFSGLAQGLGVDVAELFADRGREFETGTIAVARQGDFAFHQTENYTYEMLFPDVHGKSMVPMRGTLKPRETVHFDHMVRHPGEEFLMVLTGRVVVQFEGQDELELDEGDCLYFDSGRGHLYAAEGQEEARILVVCSTSGDGSGDDLGPV
ncbi:helix-turn-helix domain-containing protein [Pseudooceanicola sp. MF1-13]|uniref:helix-turn-helix domain-containing protein n=1 Tax=Pseudooceanicola sp. MF1-13 TaxID=3379095 RepID=UPI003891A292